MAEGLFDIEKSPEYFSGWPWNNLVKSALVLENNIRFPPGIRVQEDFDFFIVAYALAKSSFYLDRRLYHHNATRPGSLTRTFTRDALLAGVESRKKAYARVEEICGAGGGD